MVKLINGKQTYILIGALLLVFVGYCTYLISYSHKEFPQKISNSNFSPYLSDKPISEDGYYMLTVAWNLASGKGFNYNYDIPTTGVQPIATLMYAAVAKMVQLVKFDKPFYVRIVLFYSVILLMLLWRLLYLTVNMLCPTADSFKTTLVTLLLTLFNFKLLIHFMNGLETGHYLIMLYLSLFGFLKYFAKVKRSERESIKLGIVLGITLVTRLDFAVILICLVLLLLFMKKINLTETVALLFIPAIMLFLWMFFSYSTTGSWIQSSVNAQTSAFQNFNLIGIRELFNAFFQPFIPFIYTGNKQWLFIALASIIITAGIYIYLKHRTRAKRVIDNDLVRYWSIPIISLTGIYLMFSSASYFFSRYFIPLYVLTLPTLAILLLIVLEKTKIKVIIVGLFIIIGLFLGESLFYFHSGKLGVPQCLRIGYIQNHFKDSIKIGTWQSGVTGFYCPNVYNLDGKIDQTALNYAKSIGIEKYIDAKRMDVLIEWKEAFQNMNKEYLTRNWILFSNDIGDGRTCCYVRKDLPKDALNN